MPSDWICDLADLRDFFSYVVVSAPDEFPVEDYLPPEEQMTLEKAFEEIGSALRFVEPEADPNQLACVRRVLSKSLEAYRSGDDIRGAHLLQDVAEAIFGTTWPASMNEP